MDDRFSKLKRFFYLIFSIYLFNISTTIHAAEKTLLQKYTQELIQLHTLINNGKKLSYQELTVATKTAQLRRDLLIKEMANQESKQFLLPQNIINQFPQQMQAYLEQEVNDIEGILELRAAIKLNANNTESIEYLLADKNEKWSYLHFYHNARPEAKGGDQIKVRKAYKINSASGITHLFLAVEDFIIIKAAPTAIPSAFGPQRTIVFLINFQDKPTVKPWTLDQVKTVVFTTVNNMFNEFSYKQTTVVGDAIGWYTIALNSNLDCDTMTNSIPTLAQAAATQAGVDLSSYKRRIYMYPNNPNCSWAGLGNIGPTSKAYTNAWLNGYNYPFVTGHEMGHNLGLYHARFLKCPNSPNEGNCTTIEYGDGTDTMGQGSSTHFNAFQKERLGWLNYQVSPPLREVTATGTYTIDPMETDNKNVKALKIVKANLANGSKDYYYLELRQNIGFDAPLANCRNCDYTKGIVIHQANSSNPDTSYLLDMTPSDNNPNLVALLPGKSFTDANAPNGGVTIAVNAVSTTGASVTVTLGGTPPTCVRAAPTISINPNTTQWISAGTSANYTISVKNNDSAQCAGSTYALTSDVPSAMLKATLNPKVLILAPGQTTSTTLTLLTSIAATPLIYTHNVKLRNTSIPNSATTTVTALLGVR